MNSELPLEVLPKVSFLIRGIHSWGLCPSESWSQRAGMGIHILPPDLWKSPLSNPSSQQRMKLVTSSPLLQHAQFNWTYFQQKANFFKAYAKELEALQMVMELMSPHPQTHIHVLFSSRPLVLGSGDNILGKVALKHNFPSPVSHHFCRYVYCEQAGNFSLPQTQSV